MEVKKREVRNDESVFPLLTFDPDTKIWSCLGTGFFITAFGGFITARHVVMNAKKQVEPTLYAVQTTSRGEHHLRVVENFGFHKEADIVVGMLGGRRLNEEKLKPEKGVPFKLSFNDIHIGELISSYAFPLTESEVMEDEEIEFTFQGKWSSGYILDYREQGVGKTKNRCYVSDMDIKHGSSGGPVLKDNKVIGINSSGMERVYSAVTPIDLIMDIQVPGKHRTLISVKDLVRDKFICVE